MKRMMKQTPTSSRKRHSEKERARDEVVASESKDRSLHSDPRRERAPTIVRDSPLTEHPSSSALRNAVYNNEQVRACSSSSRRRCGSQRTAHLTCSAVGGQHFDRESETAKEHDQQAQGPTN
ncbi:hypothetical protein MRX96_045669 [Rhipicephalus microplus]